MTAPKEQMIIDRVDNSDNVIGPIARGHIFRERANFRSAHVFVLNSDGHLLLQKLSRNHEDYPNIWGSSAAGYIFSGETYEDAAKRKLIEELGIQDAKVELVGKTALETGGGKKFVSLFITRYDGPIKSNPEEMEETKYFHVPEIQSKLASSPD